MFAVGVLWLSPAAAQALAPNALVFVRAGDIYAADPNNATVVQRLTINCNCREPALSPDGQLVVFEKSRPSSNRSDLWIVDINGFFLRELFHDATHVPRNPTFAPEGDVVIFDRDNLGGPSQSTDLYSIKLDGSGLTQITSLPGFEEEPTVSPDGKRIVFRYQIRTKGGSLKVGKLGVVNRDGSQLKVFQTGGMYWPHWPVFSPNGAEVALSGWRTKKEFNDPDGKRQVFVAPALKPNGNPTNGGKARQITHNADDNAHPAWGRDRGKIAFATQTEGPSSAVQLLGQYVPQLRYDSQESYFADSAAEMTDNSGNTLRRQNGAILATADTGTGYAHLSLGLLGPSVYASGDAVLDSDHLDARGSDPGDYFSDYQYLRLNPAYPDRIYGRVKQDANGKWWLQYWFFYYFNSLAFLGRGYHEGDWEMIQVGLDPSGAPDVATYAQHTDRQTCDYAVIPKYMNPSNTLVPVVYVASSSHASYFTAGTHVIPGTGGLLHDSANGEGPYANPTLEIVHDPQPGWVGWPGFWGADGGSPRGPVGHGQWDDPDSFSSGGSDCDSELGGGAPAARARSDEARPPAPRVSAHLDGQTVKVSVRGESATDESVLARVLLTVHSSGEGNPPSQRVFRWQEGKRDIQVPRPIGPGPLVVRASAFTSDGTRSRVVSVPVDTG